jgi:hypothetical protein
MPVSLAGLPTSEKVSKFVHDLLVKSGELSNQPSFEMAIKVVWEDIVVPALDAGDLEVIQVGDEKWIRNTSSKMTKDNRICLSPRTMRHNWGSSKMNLELPPRYAEEQETRASVRLTINRPMLAIIQKAALVPEVVKKIGQDPAVNLATMFVRNADKGGQPFFYVAPFFDSVGREYGEGLLSYTGNQMVRNLIEFYDSVDYNPIFVKEFIEPLVYESSGVKFENFREVLDRWEDILLDKWAFKNPWHTLRMAVFYNEVVTQGYSGAHLEYDFRTSGPLMLGLLSRDRNMMADTNMFGVDNRDCRNTVASLVVVPAALKQWEDRLKSKDVAKPFVTQTTYGQGPKGAVAGLFWKDAKKAPGMWLNGLGMPQEAFLDAVLKQQPNLFNPDWIEIIQSLGWMSAYSAFHDLSSSYYNSFWGAYKHLKGYCLKVEKAGMAQMASTGCKPEFTNIAGWRYCHHKWEVEAGGKVVRLRYNGPGCWKDFPRGFEVSIGSMIDTADLYSLVVRMTHQADAWIRNDSHFAIRKDQMRYWGRYVGHMAVHDALIVPVRQGVGFHKVVRPVLHRFVENYVPSVDKFLKDNGQEPPTALNKSQQELVHWSIANNKRWLNL